MNAFLLVQTIYWLALCAWFGGVLFIAFSAPIILRTVREADPTLPTVLSVNLENEHAYLLGSEIVGNIIRAFANVQLACAGIVILMLGAQWGVMDRGSTRNVIYGIVRATMFLAAVIMVLYDRRFVWPKLWKYRQDYLDHADEPDLANAAKEQYDRYHQESMWIIFIELGLLGVMIAFSSTITRGF